MTHPQTKQLKRLYRRAKKSEEGESRSFKEFARSMDLGEDWLLRKAEQKKKRIRGRHKAPVQPLEYQFRRRAPRT